MVLHETNHPEGFRICLTTAFIVGNARIEGLATDLNMSMSDLCVPDGFGRGLTCVLPSGKSVPDGLDPVLHRLCALRGENAAGAYSLTPPLNPRALPDELVDPVEYCAQADHAPDLAPNAHNRLG
jgi:hypothetical protein